MQFELQPTIENRRVRLAPLRADDFDALYAVAPDPLIWERHPTKNRYQRDIFAAYFQGAIESGGAGNLRSRKAMEKLGGLLIGEVATSYYGEPSHQNVAGHQPCPNRPLGQRRWPRLP